MMSSYTNQKSTLSKKRVWLHTQTLVYWESWRNKGRIHINIYQNIYSTTSRRQAAWQVYIGLISGKVEQFRTNFNPTWLDRIFDKIWTMFPNVLSPSPLYQGIFRAGQLAPHPGLAHTLPGHSVMAHSSTSFLVENLLRERTSLLHRPTPTVVTSVGVDTVSSLSRRSPITLDVPGTSSSTRTTPYLKFGVSAILGDDQKKTPSTLGKLISFC